MTREEAIKRIKAWNLDSDDMEVLSVVVPELAESEDERIINELQTFLASYGADYFGTGQWQKFEDWLEKQKESLHIAETCKENANSFTDDIIEVRSFQRGLEEGIKQEREKQKEQKPAEWSEEDEEMRKLLIAILEVNHPSGFFKANEIGDVDMRGVHTEELVAWLESLRPLKDCSGCAKHLEGYISGRSDAENKLLEQFGALITPEDELHIKPRWKPSEEQMEALRRAVNKLANTDAANSVMLSIMYDNLKKL